MRVAVFSDIHGNISGLRAVLAAIARQGSVDTLVSAGDQLGGGPGAADVLDLLVERDVRLLRGNADEWCLDLDAAWRQQLRALQSVRAVTDVDAAHKEWLGKVRPIHDWLRRQLSHAHRDLLASLPLSATFEAAPGHRLLVCHANPATPWAREQGARTPAHALRQAYGQVDAQIIAYGHVHRHHVLPFEGKLLVWTWTYHPTQIPSFRDDKESRPRTGVRSSRTIAVARSVATCQQRDSTKSCHAPLTVSVQTSVSSC